MGQTRSRQQLMTPEFGGSSTATPAVADSGQHPVVVIGAGPAGLSAAYELVRGGSDPLVLEKADRVGGLARTETFRGYGFDIGGHRFFTQVEEVEQLWHEMLGSDFHEVSRRSCINYRGRFFKYPLDFFNVLRNLGPFESSLILLSYLRSKLWPHPEEATFEQWVTNRFGRRLYEVFFRTYTEKVWGMPCDKIQAEWAAQRIKGLSLRVAAANALFGTGQAKSLITKFHYPVFGPGMMWQRFREEVEACGGSVQLEAEVIRLQRAAGQITELVVKESSTERPVTVDHVISSMPLPELVTRLDPLPPEPVMETAQRLRYRDFILVGLILDRAQLFDENWIYVHSPEVQVGRIQNIGNWSEAMIPVAGKSSLGMEYFCTEGDALWRMADTDLIELAAAELGQLGLAEKAAVENGVVIRQRRAYPVYDGDYSRHLEVIRRFLGTLENLQTVGRNGMHRYNNMDHSMLTGMLAARNLLGESHDLWTVNAERSYQERYPVRDAS
jgi:protoporphyrinogen oxidase